MNIETGINADTCNSEILGFFEIYELIQGSMLIHEFENSWFLRGIRVNTGITKGEKADPAGS